MTSQNSRRSALPPHRGIWYWYAELGCLALGLALAVSTVRLFVDRSPTTVLAGVALAAWALALAIRRSPLPAGIGEVVHLVVGVVVLLAVTAPEARFGPLPTPSSVQTLTQILRDDFGAFSDDIAPMVPRSGHMVVLSALVWGLALFCSTTAMRLRAPVQAAVPHVTAVLALGLVARQEGRVEASVALLLALSVYALTQVAWRNAAFRWLPAGSWPVGRSFGRGVAVLCLAGLVTAVVVPLSPVTSDPALDLRRGGLGDGGPRTVVSPFVEVGSNLGARSNELLFTVKSPRAGYWRLTSLDTYDPAEGIWVLSNSYAPVRGPLAPQPVAGTYDAEVGIQRLGGIWVPAPSRPVEVDAPMELNWDNSSASLISREGDVTDGDRVDFAADAAELTADDLAGAVASEGSPVLLDDSGAPPELVDTARDLTAGLSDYESALVLQDYFRNGFTYDETVDYSGEEDPLSAFLSARSGFCQQFSTGFALAARSVGLPTRVVVGFTPGDLSTDGENPSYAVRGRHAHAWPEVRFEGIGWVPFEPTPGRGDPSSTALTGVPAQQAPVPEGSSGTEDASSDPAPTGSTPAAEAPSEAGSTPAVEPDPEVSTADPDTPAGEVRLSWWWIGLILAVSVGVGAAVLVRRRSRSATATRSRDPVQEAWRRATAELGPRDLHPEPYETPGEFALRVNESMELPSLLELAFLESARRWSPEPTGGADGDAAGAALQRLTVELETPEPVASTEDMEPVGS